MQTCYAALQARGLGTGAALRVLRQLVLERLVELECDPQMQMQMQLQVQMQTASKPAVPTADAALRMVTCAMTDLAELALDVAVLE